MKISAPLAAAALALALAGCSGSSDADAQADDPATSQEPTVEADARYPSVEALRDAAVLAGMACPEWDPSNKITLAAQSATCSDDSVLSTYASEADLEAQVGQERANGELLEDAGVDRDPVLVGPNWILNTPDAADLATQLGGTVLG